MESITSSLFSVIGRLVRFVLVITLDQETITRRIETALVEHRVAIDEDVVQTPFDLVTFVDIELKFGFIYRTKRQIMIVITTTTLAISNSGVINSIHTTVNWIASPTHGTRPFDGLPMITTSARIDVRDWVEYRFADFGCYGCRHQQAEN